MRLNSADLLKALQWLTGGTDWSAVRMRSESSWKPQWLAWAVMLWAWSNETTLTERFFCSQRLIQHLQGECAKVSTSYQAFLKVLIRWTKPLLIAIQMTLRQRMCTLFSDNWKQHGYIVFAVDGSKIDLPRTRSNQQAYAHSRKKSKHNRRKKPFDRSATKKTEQPSLLLTVLYHAGLRLPWDWRIGPSDSSERQHALEMLEDLPPGSLLTGDAGFVGYDFATTVLASGCDLLVRVGANITLLRKLGYVRESNGIVYVWADKAMRKHKPPLVFRLVVMQGTRHPIYLITSVQNKNHLSDTQVADLYRSRWGVEVFYRSFKQTFGRRKLKSQAAAPAIVELQWSLAGLWSIGLYASHEQASKKQPPPQLSMAGALHAFRATARDYLHSQRSQHRLRDLLRNAVLDEYSRDNKDSRDYPRRAKGKPAGKPIIKNATKSQILLAKNLIPKYG
jgi:IS4 transposase